MKMHVGRRFAPIAIALAIVVVAARSFWPTSARDVRRRLDALAEMASAPAKETAVERSARLARMGEFFSDDVILRKDVSSFVGGRQAVVGLALQGAETYGGLHVSFQDVEVSMTDASTANVYLTLRVAGDDPQETLAPRQVNVTVSKIRGDWLVSRGEVLRTLSPVEGR